MASIAQGGSADIWAEGALVGSIKEWKFQKLLSGGYALSYAKLQHTGCLALPPALLPPLEVRWQIGTRTYAVGVLMGIGKQFFCPEEPIIMKGRI